MRAIMSSAPTARGSSPVSHPLRIAHFRNLWIAATLSLFGDQFYLVALPWLVLQLTSSSLSLAAIMMAAAVPRAVLMLVGGALSDRLPPRRILIATGLTRAALVATVALLTGSGVIQVWHLYVLAFAFGIADAFASPASAALLPSLVSPEQYAPANAMLHGSAELSTLLGPAPAGLVVKHWGLAPAFWIDAASFVGLVLALWRVPDRGLPSEASARGAEAGVLGSIRDGLRYVVRDPGLRTLIVVSAVLNLCMAGPLTIGLATMAKFRFGSATAYGILLSCFGGGSLVGMIVAGTVKRLPGRGWLLTALMFAMAAALFGLALVYALVPVAALLTAMGACAGLVNVQIMSWIQLTVAREILGRVMSVLMLSAVGLFPVSLVIAGALAQAHLAELFLGAGGLVLAAAVAVLLTPKARAI
jgi:predicted MFS family arabinose efflux permease